MRIWFSKYCTNIFIKLYQYCIHYTPLILHIQWLRNILWSCKYKQQNICHDEKFILNSWIFAMGKFPFPECLSTKKDFFLFSIQCLIPDTFFWFEDKLKFSIFTKKIRKYKISPVNSSWPILQVSWDTICYIFSQETICEHMSKLIIHWKSNANSKFLNNKRHGMLENTSFISFKIILLLCRFFEGVAFDWLCNHNLNVEPAPIKVESWLLKLWHFFCRMVNQEELKIRE